MEGTVGVGCNWKEVEAAIGHVLMLGGGGGGQPDVDFALEEEVGGCGGD